MLCPLPCLHNKTKQSSSSKTNHSSAEQEQPSPAPADGSRPAAASVPSPVSTAILGAAGAAGATPVVAPAAGAAPGGALAAGAAPTGAPAAAASAGAVGAGVEPVLGPVESPGPALAAAMMAAAAAAAHISTDRSETDIRPPSPFILPDTQRSQGSSSGGDENQGGSNIQADLDAISGE
ncbi:unnamed protein product [Tilletia controversa]|nr:unnamed protein product [Tilletia controversa]